VHIDPIGTVVLPLLMIFLSPGISRFMIGWAKPVPVNPHNLRNPRVDDILVSMAGPAMNWSWPSRSWLWRGVGCWSRGAIHWFIACRWRVEFAAVLFQSHSDSAADGSHVLRNLTHELGSLREIRPVRFYRSDCRDPNPQVRQALSLAVGGTLVLLGTNFRRFLKRSLLEIKLLGIPRGMIIIHRGDSDITRSVRAAA